MALQYRSCVTYRYNASRSHRLAGDPGSFARSARGLARHNDMQRHARTGRGGFQKVVASRGECTTLMRDLCELAGGLDATPIPLDEPGYNQEPILWTGLHGLGLEAYIEARRRDETRALAQARFPNRAGAPARTWGGRAGWTSLPVTSSVKRNEP